MNEERASKILEIMLMNEAPMQCMGNTLEIMRDGHKLEGDDNYTLPELVERIRREELLVRDIYAGIDLSVQTEETGKLILEKIKPLVEEYYPAWEKLWQSYVSSGFQPQEVPKRLFDIRSEVYRIYRHSKDYDRLAGQKLYDKAWSVGYFSSPGMSRIKWFLAGKPVKINPKKLKLVLGAGK